MNENRDIFSSKELVFVKDIVFIMEYFIWDKYYSSSDFTDLKFDKSMHTVAYSSTHNLNGRGSQIPNMGFWISSLESLGCMSCA